jgi:thiol-disulfide isomerase/thioredoxin
VNSKWVFPLVGLAALLAGSALWLASRAPGPSSTPPVGIAPAALYAATFLDAAGKPQSLGQFEGKLVVLNFWATWCAPCREEMPAFTRVQARWEGRNVRFVGLSGEEPERVARFGRELRVNYPLWTGGDGVGDLSRRLGNRLGVLPHTAILGPDGTVLDARVGPYTESDLEERLAAFSGKSG